MKNFYLQWHLLNRCNLRCIHCYQDDFTSKEELSFNEILKIYENLIRSMELWNSKLTVALTGGEPFLFKNILNIMEMFEKEEKLKRFSIITNGTLLFNFAKELKFFKKLKDIKISLEGFSAEKNDEIRGSGSFKKIITGIEEAKAEKLNVSIMFTAMKKNLKEIENILPFMLKFGIKEVIIERFIPLGSGLKIKDEVLDFNDFKYLCEFLLKELKIDVDLKELSPFKAFKILWNGNFYELMGSECIVGKDGGAVMPSGDFYPCRRLPISQGNLKEKNLKEIFEGSSLLKAFQNKKNLKGNCAICQFEECIGCRAYVYALKGNPFLEDEVCFLNF